MNQSFCSENFSHIFYSENRKGNNLEAWFGIFSPLREITNDLVVIRKNFKSGKYSTIGEKDDANEKKAKLKKDKYELLLKILTDEVECKINQDIFKKILITTKQIKGKTAYVVNTDLPEVYFLFKQLYKNLQSVFQVVTSNRNLIVNQVVNVLNNDFPKYIIRADIKEFFESIPHDKLRKIVNCNTELSPLSKKIIYFILSKYKEITRSEKGIPRGVGVSAFLSEVYMKCIDDYIKSMPNLTYYARYVDDMILVFTPKTKHDAFSNIFNILQSKVNEFGLMLHVDNNKKLEIDQYSIGKKSMYAFDFLGYRLLICNGNVRIDLSKNKIEKYKIKIVNAINCFNLSLEHNNYKNYANYQLLINRLKFLTGNTKLNGNKSNTMIGIYCSNHLLSDSNSLAPLDKFLEAKIKTISVGTRSKIVTDIQTELNLFKFTDGFDKKSFCKFSKSQLTNIMKVF